MSSTSPTRDDIEAAKGLVLEFWAFMDATSAVSAESNFTEGGVLTIDPGTSPLVEVRGRERLGEFCRQRVETALSLKRVTRHVVSNMRVVRANPGGFTLNCYVTDYVGLGALPLPLQGPIAVADFDFDLVRDYDGHWRFSNVRGNVVFAGTAL